MIDNYVSLPNASRPRPVYPGGAMIDNYRSGLARAAIGQDF